MSDNINQPDHYQVGGIEAIDYIEAKLGPDGFRAYCLGNVLKYVSRYAYKDGQQDLSKALVYLGWAVDGLPPSEAYKATVAQVNAPTLTPEQEAYWAATDPPDPIDVLNVDKPRSYEDGRE